MQIHGFNKTTLLDYPGIVAATIFTGACNFRCPFCHNSDLVLNPNSQPPISEEEIFSHLEKRKGITRGVCITGGEPTLQPDLERFIDRVKGMGLFVKLDTNGYRPDVLKKLCDEKKADYVAMDIKSSFSRYSEAAGVDVDISKIKESIEYLKEGHVPYEFRTTVVRELHDYDTFLEISEMLEGASSYYIQGFIDSGRVIKQGLSAYSLEELECFTGIFKGRIGEISVRGVE